MKAFQKIKDLLTTTPILKVPDMDKECEYDFEITYINGMMNRVAYALV
jgi:hypothetical protein